MNVVTVCLSYELMCVCLMYVHCTWKGESVEQATKIPISDDMPYTNSSTDSQPHIATASLRSLLLLPLLQSVIAIFLSLSHNSHTLITSTYRHFFRSFFRSLLSFAYFFRFFNSDIRLDARNIFVSMQINSIYYKICSV